MSPASRTTLDQIPRSLGAGSPAFREPRHRNRVSRTLVVAAAVAVALGSTASAAPAGVAGAASPAGRSTAGPSTSAGHTIDPVVTGQPAGPRCTPLDPSRLDIAVTPYRSVAEVRLAYRNDGVATCNEVVQTRMYASAGPAVDNHTDPMIAEHLVWVADLEAAGSIGFTIAIDPCWAGIEIHRDADTLLYSDVLGDGCEMTIDTDFVTVPHSAELHVVQQTGNIQPPHIWGVTDDDVTVLTGLPNGTWYVKVYDGWTLGSTIEVNGGGVVAQSTVYDVADGSHVDISIWPDWNV